MNDGDPDLRCPLCGKMAHILRRPKKLYNGWVCRRCWVRFLGRRQLAFLVDWCCFSMLFASWNSLGIFLPPFFPKFLFAPLVLPLSSSIGVGLFGIGYIAYLFRDAFNGRGPGKWLTGLRTVDVITYEPCTVKASIKRNLPLMIPLASLVIFVMIHRGNRWGDGWANTRVVWIKHKDRWPFDEHGVLCRKCGYNLTGNVSGICPECGTPIPKPPPEAPSDPPADTIVGFTQDTET